MPAISAAQRYKLNVDPLLDAHLVLMEFQEDGQAVVERVVVNTEDFTWRENNYISTSIDVELPGSGSDDQSASLSIQNIDRVISRALDGATQRINVRMILVDSSDPDGEPILDTKNLMVIPSASGSTVITASLAPRAGMAEPVPFKKTTKQEFPAIWLA